MNGKIDLILGIISVVIIIFVFIISIIIKQHEIETKMIRDCMDKNPTAYQCVLKTEAIPLFSGAPNEN